MRWTTPLAVLVAGVTVAAGAAPGSSSTPTLKRWQQRAKDQVTSLKGGALSAAAPAKSLNSEAPPSAGAGRVMTARTAANYKLGLAAQTGTILAILAGARSAADYLTPKNMAAARVVDYAVWITIAYGSDALMGLLRQVLVKLNITRPRADMQHSIDTWYRLIRKPSWTPKDWVFPAVWIPLKALQVVAARIVWVATGRNPLATPIILFSLHAALGDQWTTAFFREQYIEGGLSIIVQFFAVLIATTKFFADVDPLAGKLLLPTNVWVAIATALNASIYLRNK